jgi:hypothetical protein
MGNLAEDFKPHSLQPEKSQMQFCFAIRFVLLGKGLSLPEPQFPRL